MKIIIIIIALMFCTITYYPVWSGSNLSTITPSPVTIDIPTGGANNITTPHLTIRRDWVNWNSPGYVRQPFIEISQNFSGFPPIIQPFTKYKFTINDEGYAAFGYQDANSPLQVKLSLTYNQKSFHFSTVGAEQRSGNSIYINGLSRQFFYVNRSKEGFYSPLVRNDDHALIFTDGLNTSNATVQKFDDSGEPTTTVQEEQHHNVSSGLVISPWYTPLNSSDFRGMRIDAAGNVGIGTYTTFGNKLAVNGTITCKEINMDVNFAWPDFVFAPKYSLMPLPKLEQYIRLNKHLPGMPTATSVRANGYKVGEVQVLMLQKIEELTLYIIALENRVKELEATK